MFNRGLWRSIMTKNSILIVSLLGLTALGGAAVAQDTGYNDEVSTFQEQQVPQRAQRAQQGRQGRQGRQGQAARRGQGGQRMMQQLNLSSEQQALFRQGRQSFQPKAQKIRAKMRTLQQQKAASLEAGDFQSVHQLIDQQAQLKAKMQHQRLRAMADFHESLSGDQLQSLQQALAKKTQRRRGQRGGARQGGPRANQGRNASSIDSDWEE